MKELESVFTHKLRKVHSVDGVHLDPGTKCYFVSTPLRGGWGNPVSGKVATTIHYENDIEENGEGISDDLFERL